MTVSTVDTQWFLQRIRQVGLSQRRLAGLMRMEPGALNRMLRGSRKCCAKEIHDLSVHLDVPVETVVEKCLVAKQPVLIAPIQNAAE